MHRHNIARSSAALLESVLGHVPRGIPRDIIAAHTRRFCASITPVRRQPAEHPLRRMAHTIICADSAFEGLPPEKLRPLRRSRCRGRRSVVSSGGFVLNLAVSPSLCLRGPARYCLVARGHIWPTHRPGEQDIAGALCRRLGPANWMSIPLR